MAPRKPAVIDKASFEQAFVEAEQILKKNLVKLIKAKLDKETNFDARMAHKIDIKIIETGTLDDIMAGDSATDSGEHLNGDAQEPQG